jgi:hypothetical protein
MPAFSVPSSLRAEVIESNGPSPTKGGGPTTKSKAGWGQTPNEYTHTSNIARGPEPSKVFKKIKNKKNKNNIAPTIQQLGEGCILIQ